MAEVGKEKEPRSAVRERVADMPPIKESPRKKDDNFEVEGIVEKIEKRMARIPKGQPGAQDDQVVVQPSGAAQAKQPPVKLPVTQKAMTKGQKAPVDWSVKWLFTWAIRQIAMWTRLGRKVELEKLPEVEEK